MSHVCLPLSAERMTILHSTYPGREAGRYASFGPFLKTPVDAREFPRLPRELPASRYCLTASQQGSWTANSASASATGAYRLF